MALATNLGYPRIGGDRELKRALEAFWAGRIDGDELTAAAEAVRAANWQAQADAGLDHVPTGDFSLYDHVLDTAAMVGAVPRRFGPRGGAVDRETYFAMARGRRGGDGGDSVPAMEMTKWFDTNYHYIVPELAADQAFRPATTQAADACAAAAAAGATPRPVLLGPVTFLRLAKPAGGEFDTLSLLDGLLGVYEQVLADLAAAGARWVQLDEPLLVLDLDPAAREAYVPAYARLAEAAGLKLLLATYFGDLRDNLPLAASLPVDALHVDLVRAPGQLDGVLDALGEDKDLSCGVVDGRNIWKTDLARALDTLDRAVQRVGPDRVHVAPSCSLLHCPVDLAGETAMDDELRGWLAFARQKLDEVALLARAINEGRDAVADPLAGNAECIARRSSSPRIHDPAVKDAVASVTPRMHRRASPFAFRREAQRARLPLPALPTTTIGSFPQTKEVRSARAAFRKGNSDRESYEAFLRRQIADCVAAQEEVGLDVLVHGEFERNDMVEYFGEQLTGYARTANGWVQSYGSRCVKPPIIYGDVRRPEPMTVRWSRYAQSLTDRPMKGMLTGPVTILQWSFVRDDQPRAETCRQIALAIRQEAVDLEAAGIGIIQIDEPALREGLPLRRDDWGDYLRWAVDAFRLAAAGVADETQIHTHMCYAEFNDIIEAIGRLDADVISVEASRSRMELLDAFADYQYPNEIGPGVYDIHSPRVPSADEMTRLLRRAAEVLCPAQLWVNPDCGLKTRRWEEVRPALTNMVEAARQVRADLE